MRSRVRSSSAPPSLPRPLQPAPRSGAHARALLRPMASVEFLSLRKDYTPGQPVLHELNLKAEEGELLVLVGPSGCGKSTALRLLAGLEEPTQGDIRIGGQSVVGVPPGRRDIAMVFQNYALYPHMSVRENLSFGLKVRKVP